MANENSIARYTTKSNARRALAKISPEARAAHETLLKEDATGIYFVVAEAERAARNAQKQAAPAARTVTTVMNPPNIAVVQAALAAIEEVEASNPAPIPAPAVAAKPAKKIKDSAPAKPARPAAVIQNGVRRPQKGKCADVWAALDAITTADSVPTIVEVKALNESKGWNINNTTIEFYAWRKFNGLVAAKK